jgi:molecular chaperone IbpA
MTKVQTLFPRSAFIGFERLLEEMETTTRHANDSYPPHNIVKESETEYLIEVAVAGFKREDIKVEQKERSLRITGEHTSSEQSDREVIHRGISTRNFRRSFRLSEYVQVAGASFQDGILAVKLKLEIPEEKQPRTITID